MAMAASLNQFWLRSAMLKGGARIYSVQPRFTNLVAQRTPLLVQNSRLALSTPGVRHFSTSRPQQAMAPFILMIIKPITKLGAILAGRGIRKWWANLPKIKRDLVIQHFKRNRFRYASGVTFTGVSSYAFYHFHLEYTPITHRQRFLLFKSDQLQEIEQMERENLFEIYKDKIKSMDSTGTKRALTVASRLFSANKEIPQVSAINWKLTVIDADVVNAVAFPNGDVVVFSGLLNFVQNDDELAIIMAHEMSHAILQHAAEEVSNNHLIDVVSIGLSMLVWAILPTDVTALITATLANRFLKYVFELPYSRKLEQEADTVGLVLAAKACFDVRYSSAFWRRMHESEEVELPEFLSTHPTNEHRASDLEALIPAALQLRKDCKCHDLPEKLVTIQRPTKTTINKSIT